MTKSHLKRLIAPKTWKIKRKNIAFIIRPKPGSHKMNMSIPLKNLLIDIGKVTTLREATYILHNHKVNVDMKKRIDAAFPVGLFDIVTFPEINEAYTIIINTLGKLVIKKLKDPKSDTKLVKIIGKRKVNGNKIQIETLCGRNILVEEKEAKKYKTGDSLMIKLPAQKVVDHKKFEKGSKVYLTKGSHVGMVVTIKEINNTIIICSSDSQEFEAKKEAAFVIIDEIEKLVKD